MVSGSLISWIILIPILARIGDSLGAPWFPELGIPMASMSVSEIWSNYIRYVGAGAVAFGGIITIVRSIPTMARSFGLGMSQFRSSFDDPSHPEGDKPAPTPRTDRDLNFKFVLAGVLIIVVMLATVPSLLGVGAHMTMRLVAAPIIALFMLSQPSS